ncbi:ABC transporter permease [Microlunatus panaciterrae]|uniref:Peptide/nickel transport system permease protein n=2 Tax=Microlunatus panaciterrae TaxID=400768 RepID=A0ABS2RIB5_9ACTN|nr:peptide/nickel transport system permease protein [Microlunatus panaciterrae]
MWAALTLNFFIPRMMPGNPAEAMMSRFKGRINPEALKALEVAFGIDSQESTFRQYLDYLQNTLTGHWGISLTFFPVEVSTVVRQALPWTLALVGLTTLLAFVLGTVIGIVAGWRRGGLVDSMLPPVFVVTSALPYFWVGMLFILVFSVWTNGALPNDGGYDTALTPGWNMEFIVSVLQHALLPALTILVVSIGGWILTMRNNMVTTLAEDYVRMGRAKGLSNQRIMYDYAAHNAILPNLAGFAMSLGFVVSGSILVEFTFNYPGVGYMLLSAVSNEDFPLMQALFVMITVAVLLAVLVCDFLTLWLDPRARTQD